MPKSDGHQRLGRKLRAIRERAGKTTREVIKPDSSFYASGHIANVEGGYVTFPKTLLLAYSRLGGDYASLAAEAERLPRRETRGANQTDPDDDALRSGLADPASPEGLLRRGYAIDSNEDTAYFGQNRAATKMIHQVVIRPLLPTAKFFVCRHGYIEDPRPDVLSVRTISGCEIARISESEQGVLDIVLEFNQDSLDDFGRCTLSWVVKCNSDRPATPELIVGTRTLVPRISKRVQFIEPALPTRIWWFRDNDSLRPHVEPTADQIIPLNSTAYYFHEFVDVEAELCGLAWKWAD